MAALADLGKQEQIKAGLSSHSLYSVPLLSLLAAYYGTQTDSRIFQDLLAKLGNGDSSSTFDKLVQTFTQQFGVSAVSTTPAVSEFVISEVIGDDGVPRFPRQDASAAKWGESVVKRLHSSTSISGQFTSDQIRLLLTVVGKETLPILEEFLELLVKKFMASETLRKRAPELARAFVGAMTALPPRAAGPIVDYIEMLFPDMATETMLQMVFSQKSKETAYSAHHSDYVTFLMSILLHQSSWNDLQKYIFWVLQKDRALQVRRPGYYFHF